MIIQYIWINDVMETLKVLFFKKKSSLTHHVSLRVVHKIYELESKIFFMQCLLALWVCQCPQYEGHELHAQNQGCSEVASCNTDECCQK